MILHITIVHAPITWRAQFQRFKSKLHEKPNGPIRVVKLMSLLQQN